MGCIVSCPPKLQPAVNMTQNQLNQYLWLHFSMSRLTKHIVTLLSLFVMCISTGNAFFAATEEDSCCQVTVADNDDCGDEDKDCNNSGNPFQSCGCCLHIWMPSQVISFQPASYPPAVSFLQYRHEVLSDAHRQDFWQPPRFS